jgi:hypothetical protein
LESKLTEFHGEFPDTQLPPKRILFGPRGTEFMESKRQVFRLMSPLFLDINCTGSNSTSNIKKLNQITDVPLSFYLNTSLVFL